MRFLAILMFLSAASFAQPKISSVMNAASRMVPGTPHYGIAQGSVIHIDGQGIGPEDPVSIKVAEAALGVELAGVTAKVTVDKTTTDINLYSVSETRVVGILPAATPIGNGTLTLTYAEKTSVPAPLKVVTSTFGIVSVAANGVGTAKAIYAADAHPVTFLNSANPGETLVFEGTGLGADMAMNDETMWIESPTDMPDMPFEFYFGSVKAQVNYRGRSNQPGWDRVEVVVPDGISGCFTSAYAKTGEAVSNFVTVPIASEGRICIEQGFAVSEVEVLLSREVVNAGWLSLGQFSNTLPAIGPLPASTTITDSANAGFIQNTPFAYGNYGGRGDPGFGSCVVTQGTATNIVRPTALRYLDAGDFIPLTLPNGTAVRLLKEQPIPSYVYSSAPPERPSFIPKEGGTFRFNITGGEDIGATEVTIKTNGAFTWENRSKLTDVNRSSGLEVTWTGGDPDTYMIIYGASATNTDPSVFTSFNCAERVEAGKFSIPRDVLSSMVASAVIPGPFQIPSGQLAIINYKVPEKFSADGLDSGNINFYFWDGLLVNYR